MMTCPTRVGNLAIASGTYMIDDSELVLDKFEGIAAWPTANTKALFVTWPSVCDSTFVDTVYTPSSSRGSVTLSEDWSPSMWWISLLSTSFPLGSRTFTWLYLISTGSLKKASIFPGGEDND
jgi:hypothetical protein